MFLENQNVRAKHTLTADRRIIYAKGMAFRKYESVETLYIHECTVLMLDLRLFEQKQNDN